MRSLVCRSWLKSCRGIRLLGVDQHDIVQGIPVKAAHGGEIVAVSVTLEQLHNAFFDTSGDFFNAFFVGLFISHMLTPSKKMSPHAAEISSCMRANSRI